MSDRQEDLMPVAIFGRQVGQFMSSDIGKYMLGRARDQYEAALDEFKRCDVNDVEVVRGLQNQMKMAENVRSWLEQAVQEGLQALKLLEDGE